MEEIKHPLHEPKTQFIAFIRSRCETGAKRYCYFSNQLYPVTVKPGPLAFLGDLNQGGAEDEESAVLHRAPAGRGRAEAGCFVVRRRVLLPSPIEERAGSEIFPEGERNTFVKVNLETFFFGHRRLLLYETYLFYGFVFTSRLALALVFLRVLTSINPFGIILLYG